jgi:hypothetical protein
MAVLALGACDDDDDPSGPQGSAQVRIVNATTSASTASLNVFRGNTSLTANVPAGNASACSANLTVPAGNQTLNVRRPAQTTNDEVITHNFLDDQRYTIVIYGTQADMRHIVIQDEATQGTGAATARRLRFVNASTNATAGDVFARSTTTGNPTGAATVSNVASGATGTASGSAYIEVPNANTFFQLFNTGTGTTGGTVRSTVDLSNLTLPTSRNATVVFTDATSGFAIPNCT